MASQFNKNPMGKIGDIVYYTGEIEDKDTDSYTKGLMNRLLIPNTIYTITHINHPECYCDHYSFSEISANNYWYPSNCFIPVYNKKFLKAKYGLK